MAMWSPLSLGAVKWVVGLRVVPSSDLECSSTSATARERGERNHNASFCYFLPTPQKITPLGLVVGSGAAAVFAAAPAKMHQAGNPLRALWFGVGAPAVSRWSGWPGFKNGLGSGSPLTRRLQPTARAGFFSQDRVQVSLAFRRLKRGR